MLTIAVKEVRTWFEDYAYRAPMKFRGTVVDRVTLLNVEVRVGKESGDHAFGFGSMPLGNVWSFPSARLSFDQTLDAMQQMALEFRKITESYDERAHPVEINHQLEPLYLKAAGEIQIGEPVPKLCALVVASAFDAAIHDAYGRLLGVNCYWTYGHEVMKRDLSRYLDESFRGDYLECYISTNPAEWLHVYHLVGALDPLTAADVTPRLNDGLPETLEQWIRAEAIDHIKIKLDGNNLQWDIDRVLAVNRVLNGIDAEGAWVYSLDFNERCPNADYVIDCLLKIRDGAPDAFRRIQYLEQPTSRDLSPSDSPRMHDVAKLKPVVIDEALVDYASLLRARELGYSGVALKACKGQTNALLMAAAARKFGMFLCVQDLTCPGASLLHSAGLAAHIPPISAVESNGRQYVPAANAEWESRFPEIFRISGGRMRTGGLTGPGLGVMPPNMRAFHA